MEDGHYMVRAEIPGVDPEKDVDVSVANGMVTIRAERAEEKRDRTHSEFHYGRLVRTVLLPITVQEESATAHYANGILEVLFKTGEPRQTGRHVAIEVAKDGPKPVGNKPVGNKIKS
jgi:HSP20 family molecular chaperone IbpA